MKKNISIILVLLLIISFFPINSAYGYYDTSEYLDVRIGKNFSKSDFINLSSENGFYIYDKFDKDMIIFPIMDRDIIITSNEYGDLDVLDLYNTLLTTIPGDGTMIIGSGSMDSVIGIGKNKYRGFVNFIAKGEQISLINHVEIEDYLYGVVPKEMGSSFHVESLKAQSITARTFAMASKNKHQNEGFNLCDTTHCQVYGGKVAEHPNTNRAVDETKGLSVYYNGNLAETVFHSNNGGYIESSKDTWGGHFDYLVAKEDPFSSNTTASTWEMKLTSQEMDQKILSSGINIGNILDVGILETTSANRVANVKLIGTLGEEIITGARLRTILGMRSTWFDIKKEGKTISRMGYVFDPETSKSIAINLDNATIIDGNNIQSKSNSNVSQGTRVEGFTFNGRGYGHGVGMSQYGALEMAKQGYTYEEIIKHYYTGVEIVYNGQ